MKTDIRLSSKMHLFIIISVIIIIAGLAVGTACHFVTGNFFNYGADWSSYKSVTVSYEEIDFGGKDLEIKDEVDGICKKAFEKAGVGAYSVAVGERNSGGEFIYKFAMSTDDAKLDNAVLLIQTDIDANASSSGGVTLSAVSRHTEDGFIGSNRALIMGSIALASLVAFHFVYFIIRYRLTMAFAALLADVHNLALYLALLALTRTPVGTAMYAFAALTVLITVIGTCFVFDRVRKNAKDEDLKKLSAFELTDKSASESLKINIYLPLCFIIVAAVLFVLLTISSLSPLAIISPVVCAAVGFVACVYGTTFFVPSVYSRFYVIGDNYKKAHARAAKEKASK